MQGLKWVVAAGVLVCGVAVAGAQDKPKEQSPQEPVKPELKEIPEPVAGDGLYAPLAVGQGPESLKTKVDSWLVISFGPRAVVSPMIPAAIRMAKPNYYFPPEWRDGMDGYGRQYGSSLGTKIADQTARFAVGALTHEDFRYRRAESTNFFARVGNGIAYAFVDRGDSGNRRLALANFSAAAAGGFVPNLWLPDGFNTPRHGITRTFSKMGGYVFQNEFREFSPEIFKAFQFLHLPFPRLPIPEWWNKDISVARRP